MQTFTEWAEWHATLFGLTSDQDAKMLTAWTALFRQQGYTVPELVEATRWLAENEPPRYRSDHLDGLQRRLKLLRDQERKLWLDQSPPEDPRGRCVLCRGTGRVSVPTARALRRGQWGTCLVVCSCPLGKWYVERNQHHEQTLIDYEREVPGWREILREHDEGLKQEANARSHARGLDRELGQMLRRLRVREEGGEPE